MKKKVLDALLALGFPYTEHDANKVSFDYADKHIVCYYGESYPLCVRFVMFGLFEADDYTVEQQLKVVNDVNGEMLFVKLIKTASSYSLVCERDFTEEELNKSLKDTIDTLLDNLLAAWYYTFDVIECLEADDQDSDDEEDTDEPEHVELKPGDVARYIEEFITSKEE